MIHKFFSMHIYAIIIDLFMDKHIIVLRLLSIKLVLIFPFAQKKKSGHSSKIKMTNFLKLDKHIFIVQPSLQFNGSY